MSCTVVGYLFKPPVPQNPEAQPSSLVFSDACGLDYYCCLPWVDPPRIFVVLVEGFGTVYCKAVRFDIKLQVLAPSTPVLMEIDAVFTLPDTLLNASYYML